MNIIEQLLVVNCYDAKNIIDKKIAVKIEKESELDTLIELLINKKIIDSVNTESAIKQMKQKGNIYVILHLSGDKVKVSYSDFEYYNDLGYEMIELDKLLK